MVPPVAFGSSRRSGPAEKAPTPPSGLSHPSTSPQQQQQLQQQDGEQPPELHAREYRVYVESILRPLRPEHFRRGITTATARKTAVDSGSTATSGRRLLEEALAAFILHLKGFVTGCDDRKLSKAALRRARGIESQLILISEKLLVSLLAAELLTVDDMHGIWHGFAVVRGWRDSRVPQECLLQMLRGLLADLEEKESDGWTNQALTQELTLPEVHQAISVGAWPALCELLGRLPDCVTPAELQEALWQQSFVENPTHAPDHRNYRRFAVLAAQMVAIGVELEPDKVELLVQQTLDLDRPWREQRDMLSGILSAASVEDRRAVVRHLDRRFEEHADIDDFEIVCGIAEHIGIEIPREGAIRRCALRRWALDPKRGGALPVARLIDFVDCDAAIGEDVATSLRQKGRVADAALLLSRLPRLDGPASNPIGVLDVNNGDAELERLRELLALDEQGTDGSGGSVFGPVEEGAFRLPLSLPSHVGYADAAAACSQAADRLKGKPLLALGLWKEEAPFWHAPPTLLAICSEDQVELFDLVALRCDPTGRWPEAANRVRTILSDPFVLKVAFGDDIIFQFAYALGLGIANTLKRGDRENLGPFLDLRGVMMDIGGCSADEPCSSWPAFARRFLGLRLCPEEAGSNWARRPLRASQLHHAAAEAWAQLPVLRAICAHGIVPRLLLRHHLCVDTKVKQSGGKQKGMKAHVIGQLAPPGRLAWSDPAHEPAVQHECQQRVSKTEPAEKPPPVGNRLTRVACLIVGLPALPEGSLPALPKGTLVEVLDERFSGIAIVAPLERSPGSASLATPAWQRRVPQSMLGATNGWKCPEWVSRLPRPEAALIAKLEAACARFGKAEAGAGAPRPPRVAQATGGAVPARALLLRGTATDGRPPRGELDLPALADELVDQLFSEAAADELLKRMYESQLRWPE